ncbi:MAG: DinB family protein [Planctomycetota bacterium]|nr:DinB family protein [Planctomycetota bacterium]
MLDAYKNSVAKQYEAAFCTLNRCIDRCPEDSWNAPVANWKFCQVANHVLFYSDLYLGADKKTFRDQPFHRANPQFFGDYEEFEDHVPQALYEKTPIKSYMEHCRSKATEVIAAETADSLNSRCGFDWLPIPRAELHVCNIRHIQHHAAQLILRLRIDVDEDFGWVKSGWGDG